MLQVFFDYLYSHSFDGTWKIGCVGFLKKVAFLLLSPTIKFSSVVECIPYLGKYLKAKVPNRVAFFTWAAAKREDSYS